MIKFLKTSLFFQFDWSIFFIKFFFPNHSSDLRGESQPEQAPEHDQHQPRLQLDSNPRHGGDEHGRELHVPVSEKKVFRLLSISLRRTDQVQVVQGYTILQRKPRQT